MAIYYLDTCIWLNIFKKESNHLQYWKIAIEFITKVNSNVAISTIVLKELEYKTKNKFKIIKDFFKNSSYVIIKTTNEDYELARKFEYEHKLLSFYDYLHIAICKRLNLILVTRDKTLIDFAKQHIEVYKPEDLI